MTLQLLYFLQDEDHGHGRGKGWVASISTRWAVGKKERPPRMGRTRIPTDAELIEQLLSGNITVDTEHTTEDSPAFKNEAVPLRQTATRIVTLPPDDWAESSHDQPVGSPEVYEDYALAFLDEYVTRVRAVSARTGDPFNELHNADVLVGRDGTAIVFGMRPQKASVSLTIDRTRIIDALLLPHPPGRTYRFPAPTLVDTWICDDHHFYLLRANGYIETSFCGNPWRVTTETRSHGFIQNIILERIYPDGFAVSRAIELVELLGSTDPAHFTTERARIRAQAYAERIAVDTVVRAGDSSTPRKSDLATLRDRVQKLRDLVDTDGTREPEIEAFLRENSWLLSRGLWYKDYKSQIAIPPELLSRTEKAIRPDKFLRRFDDYWDVLDLKRADVRLVVGKENRRSPSSQLTSAASQVATYVRCVKEPLVRSHLASQHNIRVLHPRGLLLIGKRPGSVDDWEDVRDQLTVDALTYTDLLDALDSFLDWYPAENT